MYPLKRGDHFNLVTPFILPNNKKYPDLSIRQIWTYYFLLKISLLYFLYNCFESFRMIHC